VKSVRPYAPLGEYYVLIATVINASAVIALGLGKTFVDEAKWKQYW